MEGYQAAETADQMMRAEAGVGDGEDRIGADTSPSSLSRNLSHHRFTFSE